MHDTRLSAAAPTHLPADFYKAIIDGTHDAVIAVDATSTVIFANAAAERLFGHPVATLIGGPLDRVLPPSARATHHAHMQAMFESGIAARRMGDRGRIVGLRADGTQVPTESTILCWEADGATYYAAVLRDATPAIEQESRLRRTANEAKRLACVRSEFLASMSHELRTPLNAVLGFAECMQILARRDGSDPKYHEYAAYILEAGHHLLALINDVLEMSRLESSQILLHEADLRPSDVIERTVRLLSERAARARQRIVVDVAPDLLLHADAVALPQILINLIGNSLKYSDRPGEIGVAASLQDDGALVISIADQGIGMTDDEVERATQPFQRFVKASTANESGTGLGLAIVAALMVLHDATMRIESKPDVGTTVHLVFPASRVRGAGG